MKLKYYLRGLGIGIVVTALILTIAHHTSGKLSDDEIIKRAKELGMVMESTTEEVLFSTTPEESTSPEETTPEETETERNRDGA